MNILITGVGGQGIITLKKVLSYASIKEGQFFRASELHGLSQRGGSVEVHFRFGEKIHSPLISQGEADLIIGLDLLEAARAVNFASVNSIYLANDYFIPFFQLSNFTKEDFLKTVKPMTKNIFIVEAAKICQEKLKSSVFESIFLLGFAFSKKLIPFKEESLIFGIKKSVSSKFIKENIRAFHLGKNYD
jgi:indolepyruvate ferredoxin oxidoreductase beta subunit